MGNKCKAKLFRFGVQYLESAQNVNRLSRTRLLSIEGDASGVTGVMLQKLRVLPREVLTPMEYLSTPQEVFLLLTLCRVRFRFAATVEWTSMLT